MFLLQLGSILASFTKFFPAASHIAIGKLNIFSHFILFMVAALERIMLWEELGFLNWKSFSQALGCLLSEEHRVSGTWRKREKEGLIGH